MWGDETEAAKDCEHILIMGNYGYVNDLSHSVSWEKPHE
jgi:hypothetical protein